MGLPRTRTSSSRRRSTTPSDGRERPDKALTSADTHLPHGPLTPYHLPAVLLAVVGIGVLGSVGVQLYDLSWPEYSHAVVEVTGSEVPDDEEIRRLETLSEPVREAFLRALRSDGAYETTTGVPAFTYPSDTVSSGNTYYIRYDGRLYRLTTLSGGPGRGLAVGIFVSFVVPIGLLLLVAGAGAFTFDRPKYPAALLVGVVAAGVFVLRPETRPE